MKRAGNYKKSNFKPLMLNLKFKIRKARKFLFAMIPNFYESSLFHLRHRPSHATNPIFLLSLILQKLCDS